MASKKNNAPSWAYEDNPYSKFGIIYADLLRSKKFQTLHCSTKQFYITCIVHASTEKAKECLYNALKETYELTGVEKSTFDIKQEVYDEHRKLFVFPKKHYEEYGYSKAYASKCFKELIDNGFIKVKQQGKVARKVNIYEFSSEWKRKSATTIS